MSKNTKVYKFLAGIVLLVFPITIFGAIANGWRLVWIILGPMFASFSVFCIGFFSIRLWAVWEKINDSSEMNEISGFGER